MMGIKESVEYLALNFDKEELLDECNHIAVAVVADIFGKTPEQIREKIVKYFEKHKECGCFR